MVHTTGGSEKTDGGKRPRARSGGGRGQGQFSSAFYPLLRHLLRLATTGLPAAGGLNALHSVRSAGRRGHGQPLAM